MPTLADVAKLAGVSTTTISRVLNDSPLVSEETRRIVRAAIEQTGYVLPPRGRSGGSISRLIAVVAAGPLQELEEELVRAAARAGFGMVFLSSNYDERDLSCFQGSLRLLEPLMPAHT